MSLGRKELSNLLSSTPIISVYYWVCLLNLFDQFKDELDIHDVRLLADECEKCRIMFNDNEHNTNKIDKKDTRPNVYRHLATLEANIELNEQKNESLPTNMVAVAQ